jgi:hypothetical protein
VNRLGRFLWDRVEKRVEYRSVDERENCHLEGIDTIM